jgi:hypothetical protein
VFKRKLKVGEFPNFVPMPTIDKNNSAIVFASYGHCKSVLHSLVAFLEADISSKRLKQDVANQMEDNM